MVVYRAAAAGRQAEGAGQREAARVVGGHCGEMLPADRGDCKEQNGVGVRQGYFAPHPAGQKKLPQQLGKRCVLFALEHFDEVVAAGSDHTEFAEALRSMLPLLKESLLDDLKRPQPATLEAN